MFEVAWSELLIVIIVAIIVIGPKELPALLRTMGRVVGKLRRSADEFRRQFEDSMREAGGEDLKRELDQLRQHNPLNEIRNTIEEAAREVTHPPLLPSVDAPAAKPVESATPVAAPAAKPEAKPGESATPQPGAEPGAANAEAQPAPAAKDNASNGSGQPRINGESRPVN